MITLIYTTLTHDLKKKKKNLSKLGTEKGAFSICKGYLYKT